MVAPTRGRGSKPAEAGRCRRQKRRRPHPGARIETFPRGSPPPKTAVAPTRGRGSKPARCHDSPRPVHVAPTRGRGSKRHRQGFGGQRRGSPPPGGADRNRPGSARLWRSQRRPQPIATIRGVTRSHHSRRSDRPKAVVHGDRAEPPPLAMSCASMDCAPVAAKERHPLPDPGWQSFLPFSRPTMESPECLKRRRINHDKTNRDEACP